MPRGDHVLNFSDAEDMLNDEDLKYVIHIMTSYNVFSDWLTSLVMFFDKTFYADWTELKMYRHVIWQDEQHKPHLRFTN